MSLSTPPYFSPIPAVRASDAEREQSLQALRGHWMAGRLDLDEYEERCAEVTRARYLADLAAAIRELPRPLPVAVPVLAPVAPRADGVASLSLGITGLVLVLLSMGLLFVISLPLSILAWVLGRAARRRRHRAEGGSSLAGMAGAGEILGMVGIVFGCLALAVYVAIVASGAW